MAMLSSTDRAARQDLVSAHGGIVWALCRRMANDPEDAFQDVWIHVFERLERFDPAGVAKFSTWLHAVALRKLLDRGRAQRRRAKTLSHASDIERTRSTAPVLVGQISARADLERGLAALSEEQRRVVLSFHMAGQSLEDIAEAEGTAIGTIKSRLHRARATLTKILESP